MSAPYRSLPKQVSFPSLEEQVLERWRERDIFKESLRARAGAQPWVFYEGPPTANGRPGSHHVLSRVFKDIFPRYKTMRGYYVERKGGWDCHGLPVEIAVEQKLGFKTKEDIERFGIAEFNRHCRETVFEYLEDWNALTERIGFWVDLDGAYRTLDAKYIQSVWWALKQIWDKGLLDERYKVVPYCARCGTALSSHEVAQGYKDVDDPSVFVRFPVIDPAVGGLEEGDNLLIWTTTPWTLVSNAAVAVNPDLTYLRVRIRETPIHGQVEAIEGRGTEAVQGQRVDTYQENQTDADNKQQSDSKKTSNKPKHNFSPDEVFVIAEPLLERVLGTNVEVLAKVSGADLEGTQYQAPFPYIKKEAFGERGHTVVMGDFVSAEDGTGLVHTAVAFGEDDFRIGEAYGLTVVNPVKPDGTYDERVGEFSGRWVKDADADLVADLKKRGRLLSSETVTHAYPHCWRCATPLLYYAKPSWYIATSQLRDRLLNSNQSVTWHPAHIKEGRFGKWLENNVDWAISRERYWGTPLPIWRCKNDHRRCIGSFSELSEFTGTTLEDPHRPYVDDLTWDCHECGEVMERVADVIDVWFDTGSMPFAQFNAPYENEEEFKQSFPADFIGEGIDQTRGWFYSLLAVSTLLFDRSPYKTVLCLGHIVDTQGRKMSKSLGNVVDPWEVLKTHGADAFRWYYLASKQPWDGYMFSAKTIGEHVRQFLLPLWNTYSFFILYANVNNVNRSQVEELSIILSEADTASSLKSGELNHLDRWLLSRLASLTEVVIERLDAFDTTGAGRALTDFLDELSNWYIRRSRRRFWDGDPLAFAVLRSCLVTISKLVAPFCPFIADEIYDNLDGSQASVHLCDFPQVGVRNVALEEAMAIARDTVRLGLAARGQAKRKVRQPLRAAVIVAQGAEREAIESMGEIVREELNVKELRYVSEAGELASYVVKPNYRTLGPRFGKLMPQVAAAVSSLDPDHVDSALKSGRSVSMSVEGHDHELAAEDLMISMQPIDGYQLEREGSHAVALELELDITLIREGMAREIVHAIQNSRKASGLAVEDRIDLVLAGEDDLLQAVRDHEDYITSEVLAVSLNYGDPNSPKMPSGFGSDLVEGGDVSAGGPVYSEEILLEGNTVTIHLKKADKKHLQ